MAAASRSDALYATKTIGLPRDNREAFLSLYQDPSSTSVYALRGERRWGRLVPAPQPRKSLVLPLTEAAEGPKLSENM